MTDRGTWFRPATSDTAPHLGTLVLITSLSLMTLNLFLPSLPGMAVYFGVSYGMMGLAIAGYLAVTAVLQLIMGPLGDLYGRRPVILVCLALFVLASIGCLLAQNIWVFLAFRMLQGAVVAGSALGRAIVRDTVSGPKAASILGYMGMAMAVAPMLAPILGGVLDQALGWRASFGFFTLCGLTILALCWLDLGETHTGNRDITAQFRAYPDLLRQKIFWAHSLCLALSIGVFFAFVAGAPLVAAALFDLPPSQMGGWLGAITMGFMVGNFLSGRLSEKGTLGQMMMAGRITALLAPLLSLGLLIVVDPTPVTLFGPIIFAGIGNGLTSPSANVGLMSVRADLAGSASGLSGALTVAFGAVASLVSTSVLTPTNAHWMLMVILTMLILGGLICAAYVRKAEHHASD